jgi:hypothetical protein
MTTFIIILTYSILELTAASSSETLKGHVRLLLVHILFSLQRIELLDRVINRVLCHTCVTKKQRVDNTRGALTKALHEATKRFATGRQPQRSEAPIDLFDFADADKAKCTGEISDGRRCGNTISRAIRRWIKEDIMRFWRFHFDWWVEELRMTTNQATRDTLAKRYPFF